jgi:Flp pilus assembly protein TadD
MSRLSIDEVRRAYIRALELDPSFAEARAEYAFSYVLMLLHGESNDPGLLYKAEEEARRALSDQPRSGRAHSVLAGVYLLQGRNERIPVEIEAALKENPNDVAGLNWMIWYHRLRGEYAPALELATGILSRVPIFFPARMGLGFLLLEQGDMAGALREHEKAFEQSPENVIVLNVLLRTLLLTGDLDRAAEVLASAQPDDRDSYALRLNKAKLHVLEGRRDEALREMDGEVLKFGEAVAFYASEIAEFYSMIGDTRQALDWLDRAVRNGDERAAWFRRDPFLAGIRDEPRFTQILESIAYRRQSAGSAPSP